MERLRDFPKRGVCWNHTAELVSFLTKRGDLHINPNLQSYHTHPPKGVAWSEASCWGVSVSSHQPEYYIEQLIPFLPIPRYIRDYPLIPEECIFPKKWCMVNKEDNYEMLTQFMHEHSSEWANYRKTWCVTPTHFYFHYPPCSPEGHSDSKPQPGYKLITTQQFITHVLTHTDKQNSIKIKQQENEQQEPKRGDSLKVQRPNITVRGYDIGRATGIRCSEGKIKIGSGHCPD